MENYPNLNLVVLSCYTKALVRIKSDIETHRKEEGNNLVIITEM